MANRIDIIDAANLYRKLELKNINGIYKSVIISIKTYKKDVDFKPTEEQSLIIWASIIGAAIFPLVNSEADDKTVNQAIELWPYMFSEELGIDPDLISKTFNSFMHALVSLRMENDLSLWLRTEFAIGEEDAEFSEKLNMLIAGNKAFWPTIFDKFGLPLSAEES